MWVYLPPQYAGEPERRFPVLYLQDGQNVFDGATAFLAGKEWEVDETVERLAAEGRIEPLVVVAVDNGGERRLVEYTPTRDRRAPDGGGADAYGRMLVEELKPWVDRTYRTRPARETTGIGGSSLGGLVSLYLGLKHPEVFGRIAALSTTAGWDDRFIARFVDALPAKPDTRLWTDTGTREDRTAVNDARALRDALVRRGWTRGRRPPSRRGRGSRPQRGGLGEAHAGRARVPLPAGELRAPSVLRFRLGASSRTTQA